MIPDNIPNKAIPVRYSYGENKGVFFIWAQFDRWYWSAMAGNGKEVTQNKAIEAAKNWIISHKIN